VNNWRLAGYYLLLILSGLTGAAGDICLYRWAKSQVNSWMLAGLGSWLVCLVLFALLLRFSSRTLGVSFVLAAAIHTVAVLSWDWIGSESRLSTLTWMGIVVTAVGVLLIEIGLQGTD